MSYAMVHQDYLDIDLFYSGNILVGFCDEFGKAYISIQPSKKVVERHKRIWQEYLNAAYTAPECFDELLMAALKRNHVPEVDLFLWQRYPAPNSHWKKSCFSKYALRSRWGEEYKPIVDLNESTNMYLAIFRRGDEAHTFFKCV